MTDSPPRNALYLNGQPIGEVVDVRVADAVNAVAGLADGFAALAKRNWSAVVTGSIGYRHPVLDDLLRAMLKRPPAHYNPLPRFGLRASPS